MSLRRSLFLTSSLLISSLVPFTIEAVAPQIMHTAVRENKRVAKIDILVEDPMANASLEEKKIISLLSIRVGDPFSEAQFDKDLKRLAKEYERVEPQVRVEGNEVYIKLKVWTFPYIRSIKFSGNQKIATKTLQKELGIKPYTVFKRNDLLKGLNKIKEYYIKKGFFEAQVSYSLSRDPRTNEVNIDIAIDEGRSGKISEVIFEGFSEKERTDLMNMIHSKKYNFLMHFFMKGAGMYNEEAIEEDRLTVTNYLQNQGYADAKVWITFKEAKAKGKIIVVVKADRGTLYHVGKVTFTGNSIFSNAEIEAQFKIRPGNVYSPEKLRQTANDIKELYGRKGYIDATVQYDEVLDKDRPVYNVRFSIDEGGQYKIGLIRIYGNVRTQTSVILHESLLVPGEMFDSAKLKATQQRLENTGYYKSVNVYAVRTKDDEDLGENYRDVFIEVEETSTGNASLFGGFSNNDSVFGGVDISENNFNYRGLSKLFSEGLSALRGGGEYFHARASFGEKVSSYSLSWSTPYVFDSRWRFGFDVSYSRSLVIETMRMNTYGVTLYSYYPFTPYWTFGVKYRIHNDVSKATDDISTQNQQIFNQRGWVSAFGVSLTFDSVDSLYKPHAGFRSAIEWDVAGLGGKYDFTKLSYVNTLYQELWRLGVMKYRFDFQFMFPMGRTPDFQQITPVERFFLGGENSVRGYRPGTIGSELVSNPEGGISSVLLSVEYNQQLLPIADLFAFVDAGSISKKRLNIHKLNLSYGFGTRLEIMGRMPITLGMGFPVNPDSISQVQRFFFSMGGQF